MKVFLQQKSTGITLYRQTHSRAYTDEGKKGVRKQAHKSQGLYSPQTQLCLRMAYLLAGLCFDYQEEYNFFSINIYIIGYYQKENIFKIVIQR